MHKDNKKTKNCQKLIISNQVKWIFVTRWGPWIRNKHGISTGIEYLHKARTFECNCTIQNEMQTGKYLPTGKGKLKWNLFVSILDQNEIKFLLICIT